MIRSSLNEGGIFSFRVSSAENYISRELSLYLSSIYRTLKSAFAEVKILPGSNNVFFASEEKDLLFDDWEMLVARSNQRSISTRFVNENFLPDRLSSPRIALLGDAISESAERLNSDLKPLFYLYNNGGMILAAADYAENRIKKPPPILSLALDCRHWRQLPNSGGLLDQPAGLVGTMNALLNVYDAFKSYNASTKKREWTLKYPEMWKIIADVIDMRTRNA